MSLLPLLSSLRNPTSAQGLIQAEKTYSELAQARPIDLADELMKLMDSSTQQDSAGRAHAAVLMRTHVNKNPKDFMVRVFEVDFYYSKLLRVVCSSLVTSNPPPPPTPPTLSHSL